MKIGVYIGDLCQGFQQVIIKTLESYAREKGITIYIFGCFITPGNNILHAEGEKSIIYLPRLTELDGIICAGDTMNHFGIAQDLSYYLKESATCPVVSLRAQEDDFYNVLIDDENAIYEMTRHFIQEGKKEICFVTGRMEMIDAKRRFTGYKKALQEAGLPIKEENIFYGNYWMDKSAETIDYFFREDRPKPDIIICSNDYAAIGLSDELKKRGIRIPEDIYLTGFDNLPDVQFQEMSITSVEVPFDQMAKDAVDILIDLKEGKQVEKNRFVKTRNIFRESTGGKQESTINKIAYLGSLKTYRQAAKSCVYMGTEFEGALNEQECLEWAVRYYKEHDIKNCFICMYPRASEYETDKSMSLRHYFDKNGNSVFTDIPFGKKEFLPKEFLSCIHNCTSLFLPIHCKNEIYGYVIIQEKDDDRYVIDERFEFLNLVFGNSLKKVYMYSELFAVDDIMQLYLKDPLTEIYNRRGFDRNLVELHQKLHDDSGSIAMVSIDMDGLKYINDHFGHAEGDFVLQKFSVCLKKALKENEFCARIGGDEFAAVLIIDHPDRTEVFRDTLNQTIWEENTKIDKQYQFDYSIGICLVKEKDTFMECMHKADERMYKEKKGKKGKYIRR